MASYHFTWDLEYFGYVGAGTTGYGAWKIYARCIASTFLLLAGISLHLANDRAIRWKPFWTRLAMIAGAAAAITGVTYLAMPDEFIFFGILHEIAAASLLGLLFLRLPVIVTAVVAAGVVALPFYVRLPIFDHPAFWWSGLGTINPRSNDFVPIFPWFGAVLAGIALSKLATIAGVRARLTNLRFPPAIYPLLFAGRHSLAFYLIHQPLLFGALWLFAQIHPAPAQPPQARFKQSCEASCGQVRDVTFCRPYCACMAQGVEKSGDLATLMTGAPDQALRDRIGVMASVCTDDTELQTLHGDSP